nr:hypothetical protein [Angustibacter aerolatus]
MPKQPEQHLEVERTYDVDDETLLPEPAGGRGRRARHPAPGAAARGGLPRHRRPGAGPRPGHAAAAARRARRRLDARRRTPRGASSAPPRSAARRDRPPRCSSRCAPWCETTRWGR